MNKLKVIISGGGTGGHIFPAISIANEIQRQYPFSEILFVGAKGRMEMEKVPDAGYKIVGLDIQGIQRRITWKNLFVPVKLILSILEAKKIIKDFKPDVVVGVGGYASGPTLLAAASLKIPTLIQEQNSYAGLTNKWLAKRAKKVCVAYPNMEKYFPIEKIVFTGNPIRNEVIQQARVSRSMASTYFGLDPTIKTVLIMGGSLGAKSISDGILFKIDKVVEADFQIIWQTGKAHYERVHKVVKRIVSNRFFVDRFITRMDYAYAAADIIVSRAGAGTISELCLVGKPVILVPSPNVTADHQTKNANALVDKDAAIFVKDSEALKTLDDVLIQLVTDENRQQQLAKNIKTLGVENSAELIVKEMVKLIAN